MKLHVLTLYRPDAEISYNLYIIPDLHNLLKQFYQIKVYVSSVVANVYYMHTGSVSASVSVYSNDNIPSSQETVRIPSRLTLSLHVSYLL